MAEEPEIHPSTSSSSSSSSHQPASQQSLKDQTKAPNFGGINLPNGNVPVFPIMYPALVPGLFPPQMGQEHMNRGPGLYAVPVLPFMQPFTGIPYNNLIPFTYNIPTERSSQDAREASGEQGQPGEQPQPPLDGAQRQVIRRFQIAIQIDLLLILKLAALIFLFNQDGSKQRLAFLVFLASLIYLYQTGALAPVIRWLSQGMHRAAAPPPPARAAGRPNDLPAAVALGNEDVGMAGEQPAGENDNQQMNDGNLGNENENAREPGQGEAGNRWRAVLKEIQMVVFGFITSLLPGFHNID